VKTYEIRKLFLEYFKELGHTIVESSPVIPLDDPTLLFTNAGMNQFKDTLLGKEKRTYTRAASAQKCIRAGGKHNDLENVGHTARHLTFFEMLGNWSFGDYYKLDAIKWAWVFLTEKIKLPPDRLYVSVYKDDDESYRIWNEIIGIPSERICRLGDIENGDEENFWSMGATGPCGPCTEIHYDTGAACNLNNPDCDVACDCDRFIEIWNNVFMEFNRDESGKLTPLKMKSVDTGMGLERLAAVLQKKNTNFDIDIFQPIITAVEKISGVKYSDNPIPFRVISDHIRCVCFAIADGGLPSNEGRGYVLRRILRRALRYAKKLNINEPFLYRLADNVAASLGDVYKELLAKNEHIKRVVRAEEERFLQTLDRGIEIFGKIIGELSVSGRNIISGKDAFLLYDTFGFPLDLTELMAKEHNIKVDIDGFNLEMENQKEISKKHSKFAVDYSAEIKAFNLIDCPEIDSAFIGYSNDSADTRIIGYREIQNNNIEIILKETPFYGESGGQVGDTGVIKNDIVELAVIDTLKSNNLNVCICKFIKGGIPELLKKSAVIAQVDTARRSAIKKNHTATHLLHKALRLTLGTHIEQSGRALPINNSDSIFRIMKK